MEPIDSAYPVIHSSVLAARKRTDRLLAPLCGGAAFLFYMLLMPHCLPPGAPAELTATVMGLPAQSPPFHLLWRSLAELMAIIPIGTVTIKLALLSAVCSALATCLVYHVTCELMVYRQIPHGVDIDSLKMRAVQIGGVVSALAFATAAPVTLAATRASLRALDVVLILLMIWLFLRYYESGKMLDLLPAAVICGLGMGENPGCCGAFAVMLLLGIALLWRQNRSLLPMLAFAGLALIMLLLVYPGLCHFCHLPGGNIFGLLRDHMREFRADYRTSRIGLTIFVLSFLPLLLCLATMNQTLNYGEDYESLLTLATLAVPPLLVLTNAVPSFRIYALLTPETPVLPSLFAAMTAGFVAAGWWTIAFCNGFTNRAEEDNEDNDIYHRGAQRVVKEIGYGVAIVVTTGMLVSAVLTVSALCGRPDWYPQRCAETILQNLGERHWLFGRTPVNTHLAILSRDRQIPLQIVPLHSDATWSPRRQRNVIKVIAQDEAFAGIDREQLTEALNLGPDAFLQFWLLNDPQAPKKIAIAGPPLLWSVCCYAPVSELFFFAGSTVPATPSLDFAERLLRAEQLRQRAEVCRLRDHNTIDMLASAGQSICNSAAYAAAVSRLAGATNLAATLAVCCTAPRSHRRSHSLFSSPLAWIWETTVFSESPVGNDFLHVIRENALLTAQTQNDEIAPPEPRPVDTEGDSSRVTSDITDLYAFARYSVDMALINQTFSCLALLDQQGAPSAQLLTLRAEAALAITGSVDQATALLQEAIAKSPRDLWARHLLVVACLQRGDVAQAERDLLPAMEKAAGMPSNDMVLLTRAIILCAHGDTASMRTARDLFAIVADKNSDLVVAREWELRLDVLLNDDIAASRDAGILTAHDETHPQANYVLATIAMRSRLFVEADARFRLSLAGAVTPQAMMGRTRLYSQQHKYIEALQLARKVTIEYPMYRDGWLVLADVMDATDKHAEAEAARSRAAAIAP